MDPKTGRFLQEDPIWDQNLYAYCMNNPLNLFDPLGLHAGVVYTSRKSNWSTYINAASCTLDSMLFDFEAYTRSREGQALGVYFSTLRDNLAVPGMPTKNKVSPYVVMEAGKRYYAAKGWAYAAQKGLMYPTKSSVFRGSMTKAGWFGKAFGVIVVAQLGWAQYVALRAEWDYLQGR